MESAMLTNGNSTKLSTIVTNDITKQMDEHQKDDARAEMKFNFFQFWSRQRERETEPETVLCRYYLLFATTMDSREFLRATPNRIVFVLLCRLSQFTMWNSHNKHQFYILYASPKLLVHCFTEARSRLHNLRVPQAISSNGIFIRFWSEKTTSEMFVPKRVEMKKWMEKKSRKSSFVFILGYKLYNKMLYSAVFSVICKTFFFLVHGISLTCGIKVSYNCDSM